MSSGISTRFSSGARTSSAKAPGRGGMERISRRGERCGRPSRAKGQSGGVDERVHRHAPPREPPRQHAPRRLVAEDDRRRPARIMAVDRVHVGAADADRLDADDRLARRGAGSGSSR
jgi:hypothetical protein